MTNDKEGRSGHTRVLNFFCRVYFSGSKISRFYLCSIGVSLFYPKFQHNLITKKKHDFAKDENIFDFFFFDGKISLI